MNMIVYIINNRIHLKDCLWFKLQTLESIHGDTFDFSVFQLVKKLILIYVEHKERTHDSNHNFIYNTIRTAYLCN